LETFLKKNYLLILLIVPIISFINSINQAIYNFDGSHWGLILFSAESLNLGKIFYKETFIHYGIFTTLLHALILKISNNNFIFLFAGSSLVYALSIFIQSYLIYKTTNLKFAILGSFIIFFIHPYALYPWHSYYLFFFFNIYLLIRLNKNYKIQLISPLILSICVLFSESFFYPSLLILVIDIFLIAYQKKIIDFSNLLKLIMCKLSYYALPIIIFLTYLVKNNIFNEWLIYREMPKVFLDIYQLSLFHLFKSFFVVLTSNSINRIISEPYWIFFSLLIIFNIFYQIKFLINILKKVKIKNQDFEIFLISLSCLILLFQTLHSVTVFKFACGLMLGLIVFLNFVYHLKDSENKIIILTAIFLLSFSGFEFIKSNNNTLYVNKFKKKEYIKNDYFDYFVSQKWDPQVWKHLIFLDKKLLNIKKNCKINQAANLSSDGIIALILRKHFKVNQLLPWYENKDKGWQNSYHDNFWEHFDKNYFNIIEEEIEKNNLIIYTSRQNYPYLRTTHGKKYIKTKMNFLELPYSYENKNKIILIPNTCKNYE